MTKVIFIFGASVEWGAWDKEKGGWAERLKVYLFNKSDNIFLYNLGIESNTTEDLLKRLDQEIAQRIYSDEPKKYGYDPIVIFAIGKNDSIYIHKGPKDKTWVKIDQFEKNLNKLIEKARKFTDKIIFIGPAKVNESETIPWEETGESYCNENIEKYNLIVEKICRENKVSFVKTIDLLDKNDLEDSLHPNSKGHQKIFERVKDFLLENKLISK